MKIDPNKYYTLDGFSLKELGYDEVVVTKQTELDGVIIDYEDGIMSSGMPDFLNYDQYGKLHRLFLLIKKDDNKRSYINLIGSKKEIIDTVGQSTYDILYTNKVIAEIHIDDSIQIIINPMYAKAQSFVPKDVQELFNFQLV